MAKRIGLFGGTFNPIHLGHLHAARMVMERLKLTSMRFIPAAIPPHKSMEGIADAVDRLEMIRLAISGEPGFSVSEVELHREGPSYTIDTVAYFQASSGDAQLYLVVGLDAFLEIDTWKSYQTLLGQIPLVVLARPETAATPNPQVQKIVLEFLHSKISADYRMAADADRFVRRDGPPLYLITGGFRMLSATSIRGCIRSGERIDTMVPAPVGAFIRRKGLYQ